MKNRIIVFVAAIFMSACLVACGAGNTANRAAGNAAGQGASADDMIKIVTTIFPEYDWVRSILGDRANNVELTMLLDSGVDLHSYQPTADDIVKISECDLFIYVGGESDEWVEDALKESVNKDMVVINLLETLGDMVKEEEVVEGMQEEHEHDHEEGEVEYDEHVWLSLKNSAVLVDGISKALQSIDPDNAATYKNNTDDYVAKINALDAEYEKTVSSASVKTLLFADRFPFRYMTDDYGLDYYAAFVGCSAETEASFETISFLSNKVDELGLRSVFTIEGADHKLAKTVISSASSNSIDILTLDSMQSVTSGDVEAGTTYLSVMENNLEVLKKALN